jgi:hypothetical protein
MSKEETPPEQEDPFVHLILKEDGHEVLEEYEDDVFRWLTEVGQNISRFEVRNGNTRMPAPEFVSKKLDLLGPAEKMHYEELHDPLVHARNEMVRQWIARALRLVNEPHYVPELLAKNTAEEIIRLFY